MKDTFLFIVLIFSLGLFSPKCKTFGQSDLFAVFEQEITKAPGLTSLGSFKDQIVFSTDLALISDPNFIDKLSKNPNESFYIKADRNSLKIIGETRKAVEHGIFFYLHHLGYRYYFANPNWHFYPALKSVFKPIEGVFGPDYLNRRIRYNYGTGSEKASSHFNLWQKANLIGESFPGFTGHAYDEIIKRNRKTFLEHPEYFAQKVEKGTIPKDPKFDISNPELVDLVVRDALELAKAYHERYGPEFVISMDPSDNAGYCNKPSCASWKSVSDQVYFLANEVAKRLKLEYPRAYVGMYAYYLHSPPPSFDLEDNFIIYIATAFNKSSYPLNELIHEWSKKVNHLGIRDYFAVANWHWELPGKGKGTKPIGIHNSLVNYYKYNVKFYYTETLNGWITKGLGHYIAARTLWNVSINAEKEIEEFYELMFPSTRKIMKPLLDQLMYYPREEPLDNDLDKWISASYAAQKNAKSKKEKDRIDDVMEYLYALSLYIKKDPDNVQSYKELFAFLHQSNDNSNYATLAMRRVMYPTFQRIVPEINNRTSALNFNSGHEINHLIKLDSIRKILEPMEWTPYDLDMDNLRFEDIPTISTRSKRGNPIVFRENHLFLIHINNKSRLGIREGIVTYKNLKGGIANLYNFEDTEQLNVIRQYPLAPDTTTYLTFTDLAPGMYWLKVMDNREGFKFTEITNSQVAIYQSKNHPLNTTHRNNFYFQVPKTVDLFVLRKTGAATIISPAGRTIDLEEYNKTDLLVEAEKNEKGFWRVQNQKGLFIVEGIPPFFVRDNEDFPQIERKKCFLKFWK